MTADHRFVLVGDNSFHGISHLSQEKARTRGEGVLDPGNAAGLVQLALENGAEGFMFSVSPTTLAILRATRRRPSGSSMDLYPIVPYAYEYVSKSTRSGGITGMAKSFMAETLRSWNIAAIWKSAAGVLTTSPPDLLEAYVRYEVSRVRSAAGGGAAMRSMLLHEVVTDMALALDLKWVFEAHLKCSRRLKMSAGFETRNFSSLVNKLRDWQMPMEGLTIAAPFNSVGFLMTPSKEECERALAHARGATVIAMSVLAAGYLKLPEAVEYVSGLPHLSGVVAGISNESQAVETFGSLSKRFRPPKTERV